MRVTQFKMFTIQREDFFPIQESKGKVVFDGLQVREVRMMDI